MFLFKIDSQYSKGEVGKNTSIKYRFHCIWRFQVCPKLFLILFKNNTKINCSSSSRKCFIDKIEEGRNEKEEQEMAKLSEHPQKRIQAKITYRRECQIWKRIEKWQSAIERVARYKKLFKIVWVAFDCLWVLLNAERQYRCNIRKLPVP